MHNVQAHLEKDSIMDWKSFFKPTILKCVVSAILIAVTSYFPNIIIRGADIGSNYGFPFNFYGHGGGIIGILSYFHILPLIVNIIIWYLISCAVAFAVNKLKR